MQPCAPVRCLLSLVKMCNELSFEGCTQLRLNGFQYVFDGKPDVILADAAYLLLPCSESLECFSNLACQACVRPVVRVSLYCISAYFVSMQQTFPERDE